MTDFGYSHISVWTSRSFQNDVSAWMNRISAQDGVQMAWISPKISLTRALRNTDWLPSFSSSFNCISVAISRLFCRYLWSVSALVLHSLACFLLRGEISVSSYPKHIPAVLSSFLSSQSSYQSCPIISWSAVFQSSYISYFWIPSIPIFVPFLVLSGLSYFGKSFLVLYFSVQMMTLVLWTLCLSATRIRISWCTDEFL